MSIYSFAFEIFKSTVKKTEKAFATLDNDLRRANVKIPREQWVAFIFLSGLLAFVVSLIISLVFGLLIFGFSIAGIVIPILFSVAVAGGTMGLAYFYPSILAGERKKKIDNALAFSTVYLATIARSGFPPQEMFRLLSGFKEYSEVAAEASKITNDVKALGIDLPTALTRAMARSPAPEWTELLAGLRTSITVGGDTSSYLQEKARGFIAEYKTKLTDFSNLLTLLVELYITLVVVGAVFFIVTSSIMVAIGGVPVGLVKALNYIMVLIGMPMITAAFILIVKGSSPLED